MKCYGTNINIKGSTVWSKEKKFCLYMLFNNNIPN